MLRVGLTGGIASGKSTVSEAFARLGAKVLDADKVAREVVLPGQPAWLELQQVFGPEFFHPDGKLRRSKLRRLVFADPEKRSKLNAIVHPEVMREVKRKSEQMMAEAPDAVLLVDVPLLLEIGAADRFDCVVVVYVDEKIQHSRLMKRDGLSRNEAHQALKAQMDLRQKAEEADYVIDNRGGLEETEAQVAEVWQELLQLARDQRREDAVTRGLGDRKED